MRSSRCARPSKAWSTRHCLQMLKTPADAQDAAQETMLRAFRSFSSYERRSELGTWLYRIAHNICLDALKRAHKRYETASLDAMHDAGYDPAAESATPEDAYLRNSDQDMLHQAVQTLPEREQALLSLRYGDGMSYLQIARAMRMPAGHGEKRAEPCQGSAALGRRKNKRMNRNKRLIRSSNDMEGRPSA